MSGAADPTGTLEVALAHASQLLQRNPTLAAEQATEILSAVPHHPLARLILGSARRLLGDPVAALGVLEPLAQEQTQSVPVLLELGVARGEAGHGIDAVAAFRRATQLNSESAEAWRLLADSLDVGGDGVGADSARARYLKAATRDPQLMDAANALVENRLPAAESRLREHLKRAPTDVAALRMLAEVAARLRRYADAQGLLERCLDLAPSFDAARHNYAVVLNRQGKAAAALPQVERLLVKEPRNPNYRNLKGAIHANLGNFGETIAVYEGVLKEYPHQPKIWMSYAHALRTAGRQEESVAMYRHAIELQPTLGEAYWSLANLKTVRFADQDISAMRAALGKNDLDDEDRLHFEFSLGKALEDAAQFEGSFAHYAAGNALRRKHHPYDADENTRYVRGSNALYAARFFAERAGQGAAEADPIFILGMPRAGSTLVEQILSSHSLVEGTMELPNIPQLAAELAGREDQDAEVRFVRAVAALGAEDLRALGERYLVATRVQRKTSAPFFIDKMPNNCLYVGLIHLILPNAKIIDARRHPLGCCFSVFKQHFARGQNFSYRLEDIGRYYRDYVELMAHFDRVLPGRVHRVFYESLIQEPELQVRRLLDYCQLPFEEKCLRFYENERAVRTASSEQVRQPIYREGLDHWRHYEPWLGELKDTLSDVLECYPAVPQFTH
jgi:tetratricopeptide (TPR) repeat protein